MPAFTAKWDNKFPSEYVASTTGEALALRSTSTAAVFQKPGPGSSWSVGSELPTTCMCSENFKMEILKWSVKESKIVTHIKAKLTIIHVVHTHTMWKSIGAQYAQREVIR